MTTLTAQQVRAHAANAFDPAHRTALERLLTDMLDTIDEVRGGLEQAANDRGLHLDTAPSCSLKLINGALEDLITAVSDGDLWMSEAEARLRKQDADEERRAYAANPLYAFTASQLAERDEALLTGARHLVDA